MKQLEITTKHKDLLEVWLDSDKEIVLTISEYNSNATIYLTVDQATQLRDYLNQLLQSE